MAGEQAAAGRARRSATSGVLASPMVRLAQLVRSPAISEPPAVAAVDAAAIDAAAVIEVGGARVTTTAARRERLRTGAIIPTRTLRAGRRRRQARAPMVALSLSDLGGQIRLTVKEHAVNVDIQEFPCEIENIVASGGNQWSFVVKLLPENLVTIARRALDGDHLAPSLGFDAAWDPAGRVVCPKGRPSWESDEASALMREALGVDFPQALAAWSGAVGRIAQT